MTYRKYSADKIFDGYRFRTNEVLVIRENGEIEDLVPAANIDSDVEVMEGVLLPGMINCHCHLELSHMKGRIPEHTGLVDFVFKVVSERHHAEGEITKAIESAEDEMLRNGIVAVGDICNNTLTLEQKKKKRLQYYNFIEASGWLPSLADERFERAHSIFDTYLHADKEARVSLVPHAPYSVSTDLWRKIQPYFEGRTVSIHNQETIHEDEFFRKGTGDFGRMYEKMKIDNSHHQPTGKSSLQSYFNKLSRASSIILVHNTCTQKEDVEFVMAKTAGPKQKTPVPTTNYQPPTFFCLCVNANLYIENSVPPIRLFRENDCPLVLGTDSLASNWSLNLMDEIRTIRKYFSDIPLEEILQWATLNGAAALGMEDLLGSFEKGKKPGVLLMNENDLSVRTVDSW
ncbi:MAG: amidohydrolase family protein [Flavisolibacter sp.]